MPLPSNRQQAVAKALCPRGSLPDPPSGGSGVPERGIPLVCWSYALVPETYLGQRDDALCSKGASCKFKRDHLPRKGASTRLSARHPQVLGHQSRARASASVFAFRSASNLRRWKPMVAPVGTHCDRLRKIIVGTRQSSISTSSSSSIPASAGAGFLAAPCASDSASSREQEFRLLFPGSTATDRLLTAALRLAN